jgi:methylisocitrate lyase
VNGALAELYATLAREGTAESLVPRMQTRAELYGTIRYFDHEALGRSLVGSTLPVTARRKGPEGA